MSTLTRVMVITMMVMMNLSLSSLTGSSKARATLLNKMTNMMNPSKKGRVTNQWRWIRTLQQDFVKVTVPFLPQFWTYHKVTGIPASRKNAENCRFSLCPQFESLAKLKECCGKMQEPDHGECSWNTEEGTLDHMSCWQTNRTFLNISLVNKNGYLSTE